MNAQVRFGDYFAAAEDLHLALEQNRDDTEFAERGGEIVYLLDTNIVMTYLEARKAGRPGSLSLGPFLADPTTAELSDRLTIKFLMSRALPGQGENPAYLSEHHWNETLTRANVIAANLGRNNEELAKGGYFRDRFESFQRAAAQPETLMQRARELGFAKELATIKFTLAFDRRVQNAFGAHGRDAHVEPLSHSAHYEAARDARQSYDVRRWLNILTKIRNKSRGADAEHSRADNIERDAKTLATIQALYRENPLSCGPGAIRKFVFVTEDRAIHAAMKERAEELAAEGITQFSRHPRVYSPLLNFSGMNSDTVTRHKELYALKNVFREVETAIKTLLIDNQGSNDKWRKHWRLNEISDYWKTSTENLPFIFSRYFAEDDTNLTEMAALFSSFEVFEHAGNRVSESLSHVSREHAQHLSAQAFELLVKYLREGQGERKQTGGRRAPVKIIGIDIIEPISQFLPEEWRHPQRQTTLDQLLDGIEVATRGKNKGSETSKSIADKIFEKRADPKVQVLATCLYFALGRWDSARSCAELCFMNLPPKQRRSALGREVSYCIALADRMSLETPQDYHSAFTLLSDNIVLGTMLEQQSHDRPNRDDRLASHRDMIERATLMLSAGVMQVIGEHHSPLEAVRFFASSRETSRAFDNAIGALEHCQAQLHNHFVGGNATSESELVSKLLIQCEINYLGATVYQSVLKKQISEVEKTHGDLRVALDRLRNDVGRLTALPKTALVYMTIAESALGIDGSGPAEVSRVITRVLNDDHLSAGDQIEFKFLRDKCGLGDSSDIDQLAINWTKSAGHV